MIDDNSPDGTAQVAAEAATKVTAQNFTVELLNREKKDGFGKAYVAGFKTLLARDFDYIAQIDADLSHDPRYLKDFINKAQQGNDFIIGSRYVPGGGTPDWGLYRKMLSHGGNLYAKFILGSKVSDYTGGYNMFTADLLKNIDVDTVSAKGYGFLIELKYRALLKSGAVAQVPIIFTDRRHGHSKLPRSTLIKSLLLVPRLKLAKLRGSL